MKAVETNGLRGAQRFEVAAWGTRGTLPATGSEFSEYGGATCCVELRLDDRVLVLDAGSGLVGLGRNLVQRDIRSIDLLISHAHLDHVMGLPFFEPLFRPDWKVTLWFAGVEGAPDPQALIDTLISPPTLPFTRAAFACDLDLRQLPREGEADMNGPFRVLTAPLNHPGGNTGFRIEHANRSFAYCCDYEPDGGSSDETLQTFIECANLAFLDSTYTPEESSQYRGFGHADWLSSCQIARRAGLGALGLFHHAPERQDVALRAMETAASALLPSHAVRQGKHLDLMTTDFAAGLEMAQPGQQTPRSAVSPTRTFEKGQIAR